MLLYAILVGSTGQTSHLAVSRFHVGDHRCVQPLGKCIQGFVERRFYRKKFNEIRSVTLKALELRDDVDLDSVTVDIVTIVQKR